MDRKTDKKLYWDIFVFNCLAFKMLDSNIFAALDYSNTHKNMI